MTLHHIFKVPVHAKGSLLVTCILWNLDNTLPPWKSQKWDHIFQKQYLKIKLPHTGINQNLTSFVIT